MNAHSTLWHSYTDDHRGQLIPDVISNSDHITLNTNTPTRVPNTTLQQTSSPDITTVSNTRYNWTSWTTQQNITYHCIDLHLTSVCRHVGLYTNHDRVSIYSISIFLENTHEILFYRIRNCVLQNMFRSYSIFISVTYIIQLYDQTILDTFQKNFYRPSMQLYLYKGNSNVGIFGFHTPMGVQTLFRLRIRN